MATIISKLTDKTKDRFFNWLSKKLALYSTPQSAPTICPPPEEKPDPYRLAVLKPSAQISYEGSIENFMRDENLISVGENSYVRGRLLTYAHGGRISIGDWCYIGLHSEIWSMNSVSIGNRVLISHGVNIHDGAAHSLNAEERHDHFKHILQKGHPEEAIPGVNSAPIIIEDDVWISFGVTILKGVRIGRGSVIAAGAIVTHDVPAGMIYKCKITPEMTALT